MNALGEQPWQLSFSFARALQGPALETWRGDEGNLQQAQEIFAHRARMNSAARSGSYSEEMERELATV
jgi:fructose-bisphosphate aldolase class I